MSFLHRFSAVSIVFFLGASALLLFPPRAHAAGPGFDAYIGYSRLGGQTFYADAGGLNGWEAAVHVKLKPLFGVEGDVAHYGLGANSSIPHTTTVLFGPRLTVGAAGVHVFVHGLLGGEHSSSSGPASVSSGTLAFALGGGADFRIAPSSHGASQPTSWTHPRNRRTEPATTGFPQAWSSASETAEPGPWGVQAPGPSRSLPKSPESNVLSEVLLCPRTAWAV